MDLTKNKAAKAFCLLFVYSFFILLVLSPDSYIYDLYHRCDTAWFFMCGKAWMNGMVPYVDFADSKGLLLWLIYGVAWADWKAKSVYCKKEIYKSLPHYKLNTADLLLKRKLRKDI